VIVLVAAGCGPKPIYRTSGDPVAHPTTRALEAAARPWLGTPYRYGGQDREGIDCSAFVGRILGEFGVSLPRTVKAQLRVGQRVDYATRSPGDLVFFRLESARVNHVGIVLDRHRFVHASHSRGVVVDKWESDYFRRRVAEVRRVLGRQ
jgi:probable lipoprotein NlpC